MKGTKYKDRKQTLAEKIVKGLKDKYRITLSSAPLDNFNREYVPELPHDITLLSDVDLGKLQGQFASYTSYVETCMAMADVESYEGESIRENEAAIQRLSRSGEAGTVQDKKDDAYLDPASTRTREEALHKKAVATLMKAKMRQLERSIKVLSREQSRREALRGNNE